MRAYPPWKCDMFWLTLQITKWLNATVGHQYLHLGVKLASCSFLRIFISISSCNGLVFRELDFQSRGPWSKTAGWLQVWLSINSGDSVVKSKLSLSLSLSSYWFSSVETVELYPEKLAIKFFFGKFHPKSKCLKMRLLYH